MAKKKKCVKKIIASTTFCLDCGCGAEVHADTYFWDFFKMCPNCGAEVTEEKK